MDFGILHVLSFIFFRIFILISGFVPLPTSHFNLHYGFVAGLAFISLVEVMDISVKIAFGKLLLPTPHIFLKIKEYPLRLIVFSFEGPVLPLQLAQSWFFSWLFFGYWFWMGKLILSFFSFFWTTRTPFSESAPLETGFWFWVNFGQQCFLFPCGCLSAVLIPPSLFWSKNGFSNPYI